MSVDGPGTRAVTMTNSAIAVGGYWLAMVLLAAGFSSGLLIYSDRLPEAWPLFVGFALVAIAGTILKVFTSARPLAVAGAAMVGAFGVWSAASALGVLVPAGTLGTSIYFFSALTSAIVFLGTSVWRRGHAALSVTVSFVVTQLIVGAAVASAGGHVGVDFPVVAVWLIITAVLVGLQHQRRRSRASEPEFVEATNRMVMSASERTASLQRVAMLHDTVLSDLAAIALLPPGPVPSRTVTAFTTTVDMLRRGVQPPPESPLGASKSAILDILQRRPDTATPVRVSGDLAALARLGHDERAAVLQSLTQCIVNIDKHAQATTADVFIGATETDVTVMVSDDGIGFDTEAVAPEKLGIKASIRARLEAIGGRGEVWSTPGGGTTVVLTAPLPVVSREGPGGV